MLTLCIAGGFRITGRLSLGGLEKTVEGGFFRKGKLAHGQVPDLDDLWADCESRNRKTLERISSERPQCEEDRDLSYRVFEKTMDDLKNGRIGELIDVEDFDISTGLLRHRFGVGEAREAGWKVRCIDNYFANGVNSYAVLPGHVFHDNLDHMLSVMTWLAKEYPDSLSSLGIIKTDFQSAFKTLGVVECQRWLQWIAFWDPSVDRVKVARTYSQTFGL